MESCARTRSQRSTRPPSPSMSSPAPASASVCPRSHVPLSLFPLSSSHSTPFSLPAFHPPQHASLPAVYCTALLPSSRSCSSCFEISFYFRILLLLIAAGGTLATSELLQSFSRARQLVIALLRPYTADTVDSPFGSPIPTLPFYQISDVQVGYLDIFCLFTQVIA